MRRLIKIAVGLAVLGGLAFGGTALATGGGDAATGPGADQARAAAVAHLGGGTVNAVERDSENGATWEVEVTKTDGETVDVRLDASYRVLVVEGDSEEVDTDSVRDENGDESGDADESEDANDS